MFTLTEMIRKQITQEPTMRYKSSLLALILGLGIYGVAPIMTKFDVIGASTAEASAKVKLAHSSGGGSGSGGNDDGAGDDHGNDNNAGDDNGGDGGGNDNGNDNSGNDNSGGDDNGHDGDNSGELRRNQRRWIDGFWLVGNLDERTRWCLILAFCWFGFVLPECVRSTKICPLRESYPTVV